MQNSHRSLPAEWAPQSGVMLTWPHDGTDWAPLLDTVEHVFVLIAREITLRERVLIVCRDSLHAAHVEGLLSTAGADRRAVLTTIAPSNDTWARDHGPITVMENTRPLLLDFTFNGWGGKFDAALDNRINRTLHAGGAFATALRTIDMVLEGGGIESDGEGTLLTTSHCLLSPHRNPQLDRAGTEARLREVLGVQRILWLDHGHLEGDDTDSHIDTLARFCDPRTIAYTACDDTTDPHYADLAAMAAQLRALCTADGQPYRLVPLPWPQARYDEDGRRLPATYANFLIINGAVLVPTYADPADAVALERLRDCFPDREIVGIPCLDVIRQNGSLHCLTMQLPVGVLPR
jgi:agmatine deiminase